MRSPYGKFTHISSAAQGVPTLSFGDMQDPFLAKVGVLILMGLSTAQVAETKLAMSSVRIGEQKEKQVPACKASG